MRNVLLLSDMGMVLGVIHWTKAMTLTYNQHDSDKDVWFSTKVNVLEVYNDFTVRSAREEFLVPSVLMLLYRRGRRIPYATNSTLRISKRNVLARDGYVCQYCGKKLTISTGTIDHVVPVSRGGKHVWENVVAACKECNNKKNDLFLHEARQKYDIMLRKTPFNPTRKTMLKGYVDRPEYEIWKKYVTLEGA